VVIKVRDEFHLKEVRTVDEKWSDLIKDNGKNLLGYLQDHEHVEIYVSPYREYEKVVLTLRDSTTLAIPPFNLHETGRHLLKLTFDSAMNIVEKAAEIHLIPPATKISIIHSSMDSLKGHYLDKSANVFLLGDAEGDLGFAIEIALPITKGPDFDFSLLKRVVEQIHVFADQCALGDQFFSSVFSIRFGKRSKALISMMSDYNHVATIEFDMATGLSSRDGVSLLRRLQSRLLLKFPGLVRVHWGLDMDGFGLNYVKHSYPGIEKWLEVYKQLNGAHTFNNSWTTRLGINYNFDEKVLLDHSWENQKKE